MVKVSVIVPIFNASAFLKECLDSVRRQSYEDLDVVLLDDGSTDNSAEIAGRFVERDSRFRLFGHENRGLGYTRNRGIEESSGEFLFFLDSDDRIPRNAIGELVDVVKSCAADVGVGRVLRFNEDRSYVPVRHKEVGLYESSGCVSALELPGLLQDSIACNKLWKRSFVRKHGLFFEEGKLYEDLFVTMKAMVLAERVAVTSSVVYHWRVREGYDAPSITQEQMKLQNTLDRILMLGLCHDWLGRHADERLRAEYYVKGSLDVLRLHATKFALVAEDERAAWMEAVQGYLARRPAGTLGQLPELERLLGELITAGNAEDLLLLSQALQGTERRPIVHELPDRLVINGSREYDVSSFFKTEAIIRKVEKDEGDQFFLTFSVRIPKASEPEPVTLVMVKRKSEEPVKLLEYACEVQNPSAIYPYSEQQFTVMLDVSKLHSDKEDGETYDLYMTTGCARKQARVRLYDQTKEKWKVRTKENIVEVYRTNRGNASVTVRKKTLKSSLKSLL